MLDFNLLTGEGKAKSDTAIILTLIKKTENKEIKWILDYDEKRIAKYFCIIDIKGTINKKIKVELFINRVNSQYNNIEFLFNKTNNIYFVVKKITEGQLLSILMDSVKKQLGYE